MATVPAPKLVQLNPPGPYEIQAVESFLGSKLDERERRLRIRVILTNGAELHIPIAAEAVEAIRAELSRFPEFPDFQPRD